MGVSNLTDQILQARIYVYDTGTLVSGFPIDIRITDQALNFSPVFWDSEKDVALSGTKRSNIRQWDLSITLDFNTCLEPTKVKDIMDQLPNASDNQYDFHFYPNVNSNDYFDVIPTGDTSYNIRWAGTVRVGGSDAVIPTLSFEAKNYEDTIDAFFKT